MTRSSCSSSSRTSSSRSNRRPTTLATRRTVLAVSESCASRRAIISLTPSGTAIRLSSRSSSCGSVRSVSSMKNGLPSVSSVSRTTNCDVTSSRATSARVSSGAQPAELDALERRLAAQPRQHLVLELARGAEHEQPHVRGVLQQVAEQQRRRGVGPVQVVEQQHHGPFARGEGRASASRPRTAGSGASRRRRPARMLVADVPAQRGDEAGQLAQLERISSGSRRSSRWAK